MTQDATLSPADEMAVRKVVADRSAELGGRVAERAIALAVLEGEFAGYRLFHASWGAAASAQALSGAIRPGQEPIAYPGRAIATLFTRWIEADGGLPDAATAARVAAYLLDAADRHELILTEADGAGLIEDPDCRQRVRPPAIITDAKQPGVEFWWLGRRGPARVRVLLAGDQIRTEEASIHDLESARTPGSDGGAPQ